MAISISSRVQAFECESNFVSENVSDYKCNQQSIDRIITNEHGVFLQIEDKWLQAEELQVFSGGILVMEGGEWLTLEEAIKCDHYIFEEDMIEFDIIRLEYIKMWPIVKPCGNPECPSKY